MITGRENMHLISQYIENARSEIDRTHRRLSEINERLTRVREAIAAEYRKLARFRLDELSAGRLISQLDDSDRTVQQFLLQKAQALQELEAQIEESLKRQSALAAQREEQEDRRDEALDVLERRLEQVQERLDQDGTYQALKKRAADEAAKAGNAQEKAAQAEHDRVEKGRPYEADPLFMYLWNRRYLTLDYRAGRWTRTLDGWVARLTGFDRARANYYLLTELPVRLREHATRQQESAERESEAVKALELRAAESDGVPPLQSALQDEEKKLQDIDVRIEREEQNYEQLLMQRALYSSFADRFSQQAIEVQVSQLKQEPLSDLHRDALATPKPDDDAIIVRLRDLQEEEKRLAEESVAVREEERRSQEAFRELESVRRRYRQRNYDAHGSYFPGGFELAMLLGMLLQGRSNSGEVWDRIDHEQQFRRPRIPDDFGGGKFSRGGFGSGGRFGGGGFRTGGSF